MGTNAVQKQRLAVTPGSSIIVDVLGQGFGADDELNTFVRQTYGLVNTREPFARFPAPLVFDVHRLADGTLPITPVADVLKCYFTFGSDFKDKLSDAEKVSPNARFTIVVLKVPLDAGVGACAMSNDLVVTSQLVETDGLAHELGHAFGGLKDETSTGGTFVRNPKMPHSEPNCADDSANAPWTLNDGNGVPIQPMLGCEGYSFGLFHPSDDCRMASPESNFCCVCMQHMLRHLNDLLGASVTAGLPCQIVGPVPTRPAVTPQIGRFVTAEFGPGASPKPLIGEVTTIPYLSPIVAGDEFPSIVANNAVLAAASLPDPPTTARAYPPGHSVDTKVSTPVPITVTFFVPGSSPLGPLATSVIRLPGSTGLRRLDEMKNPLTHVLTIGNPP